MLNVLLPTAVTKLVVVDHSTDAYGPVSDADLQSMAQAWYAHLVEASGVHERVPPLAVTVAPHSQANATFPPDTAVMGIFDTSDAAGAAGYHATDERGIPYGKIFRNCCDCILNTLKGGSFAVATVGDHEALELWMDKPANDFRMRGDGGDLDAFEMCDAVEDQTYPDPNETQADRACALSNYLFPAAFALGGVAPFDRLGKLTSATDTSPGGYRIVETVAVAPSGEASRKRVAVYGPAHVMNMGAAFPKTAPVVLQARRQAKTLASARASRRGVTEWVPRASYEATQRLLQNARATGLPAMKTRPGVHRGPMAALSHGPAVAVAVAPGHASVPALPALPALPVVTVHQADAPAMVAAPPAPKRAPLKIGKMLPKQLVTNRPQTPILPSGRVQLKAPVFNKQQGRGSNVRLTKVAHDPRATAGATPAQPVQYGDAQREQAVREQAVREQETREVGNGEAAPGNSPRRATVSVARPNSATPKGGRAGFKGSLVRLPKIGKHGAEQRVAEADLAERKAVHKQIKLSGSGAPAGATGEPGKFIGDRTRLPRMGKAKGNLVTGRVNSSGIPVGFPRSPAPAQRSQPVSSAPQPAMPVPAGAVADVLGLGHDPSSESA